MSKTLLVVDDETAFSQTIIETFQKEIIQGLKIESVVSGTQAWERIDKEPNTVKGVLIDLVVPELEEGLTLIENLEKKYPSIKYVVYSAQVSIQEYQEHLKKYKNMIACIDKGEISTKEVKNLIRKDLEILEIESSQKFDYNTLDLETSQFVQQQAVKIRGLIRQNIIEVGLRLLEVKQRLQHGSFIDWIEREFSWSYSLAYKFMRVAEAFPKKFKSVNFTDLNIAPSALYLLAAVSVPEAARQEAIARAEAGEEITYSIAQGIKRKHTADPQPLQTQTESSLYLPAITSSEPEDAPLADPPTAKPQSAIEPTQLTTQGKAMSSPSKLEVVAIRPKADKAEASLHPPTWWQLGPHYLFCGSPTAPQFKNRLPQKVALSLAFPPNQKWSLEQPLEANSSFALYRGYKDEDLNLFRQMIEGALELYTEARNFVVLSFLPDPELLRLADNLGCCCFVADPDFQRCEAAIAAWKAQGKTVLRINEAF